MLCCPNVYSFQRYTTVALALLLESSRAHLFKHISQNTEQIYKHHQTSFINIKRKGKLQKKKYEAHTERKIEKERDVEQTATDVLSLITGSFGTLLRVTSINMLTFWLRSNESATSSCFTNSASQYESNLSSDSTASILLDVIAITNF